MKLSGPLDGLLKVSWSPAAAELTLRYGGETVVLDDDDCDRLLRVIECALYDDQAEADLCEFFEDEVSRVAACRMAGWLLVNHRQLDPLVYA